MKTTCHARGRHRDPSRGFSLIELMIVLVIAAIIFAFAIPSYQSYVMKSHRSEAIQALTLYQTVLERCYAANLTYSYTASNCPAMPLPSALPVNSAHGYYSINTSNMGASTYTLTATAQNSQASDSTCSSFTVDQTNTRNGSNGVPLSCWSP